MKYIIILSFLSINYSLLAQEIETNLTKPELVYMSGDSLLNDKDKIYQNIYKQHPLKLSDKAEHVISEIMNTKNFSNFFDLK